MTYNLSAMKQASAYCTFIIALLTVSFLYLIPTQLPKYLLYGFSIISITLNYKDVFSSNGMKTFLDFFKPWILWLGSFVVLCSIYGTSGFSRYLNTFLVLVLTFLAIRKVQFRKELLLATLAISSIVVSLAICAYILMYGLSSNIFDYNKNKLMYPVTMVAVSCLIGLLLDYRTLPRKILCLLSIAVCCSLVSLAMSEVRGALLGYLALIPVFLWCRQQFSKKVLIIFGAVIVIAVGLFLMTGRMQQGFADLEQLASGDANSSWGIRLTLWKTAIEAFSVSPWVGWGPETYRAYSASDLMITPLPSYIEFTHFHSDVFQLLVLGGTIGMIGWLGSCIWLTWKERNDPYRLALLFSALGMGLTEPCWNRWSSLFTFALLWVLFTLTEKHSTLDNQGRTFHIKE